MCMIMFGTTLNEEGFNERKMYAQSICVHVPMPEWNCVCSNLYVVALFLTCVRVLACDWRQQVVRVGAATPRVWCSGAIAYIPLGGPRQDLGVTTSIICILAASLQEVLRYYAIITFLCQTMNNIIHEVCYGVGTEPGLQPVTKEHKSAKTERQGLWEGAALHQM